ncbi:D-alanine--D-alanine ligase [Deferribacterales bacterium Es71-Z0220]|uniref:D-alanine--D-alanine ligase n=1 Tax=Deferrivibrio essentukiensis TaxID=2880922 RepID=UPI001F619FF6|nr:D-alanine--D-alanine ligase [Deferrivibrio essentukiensis]MCB4205269.1 D-alanine--D-alanine ligase [Deferrivibrio essentukiensis]
MKDKKIVVLYGGLSSEREVSLKTGKAVYNTLVENGYSNAILVDVDKSIAQTLIELKPDVCFNALHGKFGEDGTIQGLLETLGIKYTGSNVAASAVAFDKVLSKYVFVANAIPTADYVVLENNVDIDTPFEKCVVKPAREGSTIGISIVENAKDFSEAVNLAFKYDSKVIVEKFINGKELTVSVVGDEVFPPIWIRPKKGFYDYESKYTKGMTEYIFETGLSIDELEVLKELALKSVKVLGCTSAARVDFIYDGNEFYVLEVNTCPGMTETSLLPNAARKAGLSFIELIEKMLELA